MNFIFYLEKGEEIEVKKSKKTKFFSYIKSTEWDFLLDYKDYIDKFDETLRSPETHKSSMLRKHFQRGSSVPSEKLNGLCNLVMNVFWVNMLAIIRGNNPSVRYWDVSFKE